MGPALLPISLLMITAGLPPLDISAIFTLVADIEDFASIKFFVHSVLLSHSRIVVLEPFYGFENFSVIHIPLK